LDTTDPLRTRYIVWAVPSSTSRVSMPSGVCTCKSLIFLFAPKLYSYFVLFAVENRPYLLFWKLSTVWPDVSSMPRSVLSISSGAICPSYSFTIFFLCCVLSPPFSIFRIDGWSCLLRHDVPCRNLCWLM
jgi:hypothetical protein